MDKSPDAFRTISEVSEWLDTPSHVLRFWESRFPAVSPVKRAGGRRYYRTEDMALLGGIKKLLHDDGMTIKAVQEIIDQQGAAAVAALSQPLVGSVDASSEDEVAETTEASEGEDTETTEDVDVLQDPAATEEPTPSADTDAIEAPSLFEELPTFSVRRRDPPLRSATKTFVGVIGGDLAKPSSSDAGGFRIVRGDGKIKERQSRLSLSISGSGEETSETSETVQEAFIYAEEELSEVSSSEETDEALIETDVSAGILVDGDFDDVDETVTEVVQDDATPAEIEEPSPPLKPIDGIPEDPDDECRATEPVPLPAEIRALVWQAEKGVPASLDDLSARLAMLAEKVS